MSVRAANLLFLTALPLALAVPTTPAAQSVHTLVIAGEEYFGVGTVETIENFRVNDQGEWIVHVGTDALPAYEGDVFLRNGVVVFQGGDHLAAPPGAQVGGIGQFTFNRAGRYGSVITLLNWDAASDTGVYHDSQLVVQKGTPTLATELPNGTLWVTFEEALLNDVGQFIIQGEMDFPASTVGLEEAIVIVDVDEQGGVLGERAILWEGGFLPDQTSAIEHLGLSTRSFSANSSGGFITSLDTVGTTASDGSIYAYLDGMLTQVAREGQASPVGRAWSNVVNRAVALNDLGEYAFIGLVEGDNTTDQLLVLNDEKFAQKGDILEAVAPYAITNLHLTDIFLSNGGDLFWFAQFNATDTSRNQAIFRNQDVVVQRGLTTVDGQLVENLRISGDSFVISPNGRYLVFEAVLDDGREGAFLVDFGLVETMSECYGNQGSLEVVDGLPMIGDSLRFRMDDGQAPGVSPVLIMSTLPAAGWPSCGVPLPFGELLVDVTPSNGNPALLKVGNPWVGVGVNFNIGVPNDLAFVGSTVYAQGVFWDIGDQLPEQNLLLTKGLRIQIVAR